MTSDRVVSQEHATEGRIAKLAADYVEGRKDALAVAEADAKRYRWLRDRFIGADFAWNADFDNGDTGTSVLLLKFDGGVYGCLDLTIDAAMKHEPASKAACNSSEVPTGSTGEDA
jgi:hypothetical protein